MNNPPTTPEPADDAWTVTELDHERGSKIVEVEYKDGSKAALTITALAADRFLETCWTQAEARVGIEVLRQSVDTKWRETELGRLCPYSFTRAMQVALALARGDSAEKKRMETEVQEMRAKCSQAIDELSSRFHDRASTPAPGHSQNSSDGSTPPKV